MDNTTMNNNKSLVNVSVMEASTNTEIFKAIATNLTSAENAAFKVAVRVAYLLGVSIPCGQGTITNKSPLKAKAVYTKINKSKATVSRWLKAVKYIIDNELFDDFNSGVYPFSFDKIILIFSNELVDDDRDFSGLMDMTVVELEKLVSDDDDTSDDDTSDDDDAGTMVTFTYGDTTFSVPEKVLVAFIENHCTIA